MVGLATLEAAGPPQAIAVIGGVMEYMTPAEVARDLNVSEQLVYKLIKQGKLPAMKVGRLRKIDREDLERYKFQSKGGTIVQAPPPETYRPVSTQGRVLTSIPVAGHIGRTLEDIPVALTDLQGVQEATVEWGDGNVSNAWYLQGTLRASHTYEEPGEYRFVVKIRLGGLRAEAEGKAYIAE